MLFLRAACRSPLDGERLQMPFEPIGRVICDLFERAWLFEQMRRARNDPQLFFQRSRA